MVGVRVTYGERKKEIIRHAGNIVGTWVTRLGYAFVNYVNSFSELKFSFISLFRAGWVWGLLSFNTECTRGVIWDSSAEAWNVARGDHPIHGVDKTPI